MKLETRAALVAVVLTVVAVSLVAAPAAAGDDDIGIATGDGINSTIDLSASGNESGQSGAGSLDCVGQPTHHECDKAGSADTQAGSVDYDGYNYGDDDDLRAGGGDEVTVAGQGEQATFEFDCDFTTNPSPEDCAFNVTSSQGDAPGPLGESGGDDGGSGNGPAVPSDRGDGHDDGGDDENDVGIATGEGLNSTADLGVAAGGDDNGGDSAVDCVGQPTHHECDKGGGADLGPISVDYYGDNYGDDDDLRGGGGDHVTIRSQGEYLFAGFDCDLTTSPSPEDCDFDLGSSQGDAPGQFGPEEDERRDGAGHDNGQDDDHRNDNSR